MFPNFSSLDPVASETMFSRAGASLDVSKKMAWIRIISAVANGLVIETNPSISSFASNYGNTERSGKIGVDFSGNPVFAENDRAYRPSPTIDGIEIEGGNMGLSRKAKFNITCYSLAQADLLSQYMLEPGYTLLVEFGWNSIDSMTQRIPLGNRSDVVCSFISFNDYAKVKKHRTDSKGEYEGFMGYITDSSFVSSNDETYILNVEITTLGEIPTYLQVHRANVDPTQPPTGNNQFDVSDIKKSSENASTIGISLFQQMFNKLPGIKQTQEVKKLQNEVDINGNKWSHEGNYINIDETTRETIMGILEDRNDVDDLPDGTSLISDQSFIRLELAFEILNKFTINLKSKKSASTCKCETYDFRINTNDTIIRAHPWMFSTDSSKLYIPNRRLPNFDLARAIKKGGDDITQNVINVDSLGNPNTIVDGCPFPPTEGDIYEFPSLSELKDEFSMDSRLNAMSLDAKPGEWGYLRNLYINYDFFIQVLNRSDYVAKDVYYEILNGLSSAVNSYWDFDIFNVPTPKENSQGSLSLHMAIRDMSFTGRVSVSKNDDSPNYVTINNQQVPVFNASGIDCPFLSSKINIEMPAAKRNQVLAKRNTRYPYKRNTQIDSQPISATAGNVFATDYPDPVLLVLNSFEIVEEEEEPQLQQSDDVNTPRGWKQSFGQLLGIVDSPEEQKTKAKLKKNVDFFTQRATILPLIKNRKTKADEDTPLEQVVIVGAWNDPSLLKRVELEYIKRETRAESNVGGRFGLGSQQTNKENGTSDPTVELNAAIIGIEFEFEIIGLSSISVGDLFRVRGLPGAFNNSTFQVFSITHNLSNGFWTTSVTSKQRQI